MTVEREEIPDQVLDAVRVGNEQNASGQAPDVFLALEHEARLAAIGPDLPGARRREARNFLQTLDLGHEFACAKGFFEQGAQRRFEFIEPAR